MMHRIVSTGLALVTGSALVIGCSTTNYTAPSAIAVPDVSNLTYSLNSAGPGQVGGTLLSWTDANDTVYQVSDYVVYARGAVAGSWSEVGITTSNTYDDNETGVSWYLVVTEDAYGDQSIGDSIQVVTGSPLPAPASITGAPFDTAVALTWDNTPAVNNQSTFNYYNVYSDSATVAGSDTTCVSASLALEGSTISSSFVVTGLTNGSTRCYMVSTVSVTGEEGALTDTVKVTPESNDPVFGSAAFPHAIVVHTRGSLHAKLASARVTPSVIKRM